jgi:hypothetical protein
MELIRKPTRWTRIKHSLEWTLASPVPLHSYNTSRFDPFSVSQISDSEFCIRLCPTSDPDAWQWCQHIYDIQGCAFNSPGDYGDGFDTCQGDSTELPPGIYSDGNGGLSTYFQSQGAAPTPHPAGASSNCQAAATVGGQGAVAA